MVSWTPFRKALGIQWDEKVSNFALGPCLGSNSPALPGPPKFRRINSLRTKLPNFPSTDFQVFLDRLPNCARGRKSEAA